MADIPSYREGGPGHRGVDTSIAGAEHIAEALPRLQSDVLAVIKAAGLHGATGDEIATALEWERHRVRPRTSELRNLGRIVDSGKRRLSQQGVASIVWIIPDHLVIEERREVVMADPVIEIRSTPSGYEVSVVPASLGYPVQTFPGKRQAFGCAGGLRIVTGFPKLDLTGEDGPCK